MTRSFLWTGIRLAALCALLLLAACGGKRIPPRDGIPSPHLGTIRDMRTFPQDRPCSPGRPAPTRPLLDSQAQAEQDARFNRIFFGPWDMHKTSIRKREVEIYFRKARGYKYGDVRWTQDEWDAMRANARLKGFPNAAMHGITVRNADLREMPSHTPRFSEPTPDPRTNPFDYFQYSLLPVGTPVFIAHTSRDGNWYYVGDPVAAGWVDPVMSAWWTMPSRPATRQAVMWPCCATTSPCPAALPDRSISARSCPGPVPERQHPSGGAGPRQERQPGGRGHAGPWPTKTPPSPCP